MSPAARRQGAIRAGKPRPQARSVDRQLLGSYASGSGTVEMMLTYPSATTR